MRKTGFEDLEDDEALDASVNSFLDVVDDIDEGHEEEIEAKLSEVEKRLQVVSLYRLLLREPLFDHSTHADAAALVEKRVRAFVRADMMTFLGMATERPKAQASGESFSDEEMVALKKLAGKLLGNAAARNEDAPVAKKKPEEPKTTVKRRSAANAVDGVRPPLAVTAAKKLEKPTPPQPKDDGKDKTLAVFDATETKNGRLVKNGNSVVDKRVKGRLVRQYVQDGEVVAEKDITPQVKPKNGAPPLSKGQLENVLQQQAYASLSAIDRQVSKAMQGKE